MYKIPVQCKLRALAYLLLVSCSAHCSLLVVNHITEMGVYEYEKKTDVNLKI